jgi:type I restriction enzyme M protein
VGGHYGYIFGADDTLKLNSKVISYIVTELQKYSLLDTDFDYKGQAYEEIVGANSRGERGEFFTPRNLCGLAVSILICLTGPNAITKKRILDPACGTGGFLRTFVHQLHELLLASETKKWGESAKAREQAKSSLKAICDQNISGIDFNPVLVRAAQMNLVMHGDGSSNIFHENALLSCGEWDAKTQSRIKDNSVDIIVTNPPFGEELLVDDSHVLGQYSLSTFMTRHRRTEMAPQELFIERCWRLLKPLAIIAVVTPDNILSNPSYNFMRNWIVTHFQIIASVSLPGEMFQPSTGTQTSLLIMRKRVKPLANLKAVALTANEEPVFLSVPRRIGHDQRGSFIPRRDALGDVMVRQVSRERYFRDVNGHWRVKIYEESEAIADDDLPTVLSDFKVWLSENGRV